MDIHIDLSRFKVFNPQTLFELSPKEKYELLKDKRCLTCQRKLYQMRNLNWICKSKLHKGNKIISNEVIKKYE